MNCGICDAKATHAFKAGDGFWEGRCAGCYEQATPLLRNYLKRLVPMVQGREFRSQ